MTLSTTDYRLALTMGDPAGIGPEIIAKAMVRLEPKLIARLLVLGDPEWLNRAAAAAGLREQVAFAAADEEGRFRAPPAGAARRVPVLDPLPAPLPPLAAGRHQAVAGRAAYAYVEKAVGLALAGKVRGLVTAPLAKHSLHLAGLNYAGHTEILQELTGVSRVAMTFWGTSLKVMLVTTHIPLAAVPAALSVDLLVEKTLLLAEFLARRQLTPELPLAVAALNPHGGEEGAFGREEETIVRPAIAELRRRQVNVVGPVPADVLFHQARQGKYRAVVALYHDQGLIPFKMLHFADGVQLTLGLPFIRTSVDHGTAFDIAGRNLADCSSLLAALSLWLSRNRGKPFLSGKQFFLPSKMKIFS
ncbi:MAG: 4-hydroxythreonine-4-phosphate dehydrogenase PdxA [Deltaproteobacteria bacterium]|nr:4-hydroxythreonine-4-phosphate dehydrogenase PdxA [Deltaproteobacteria bacterium]